MIFLHDRQAQPRTFTSGRHIGLEESGTVLGQADPVVRNGDAGQPLILVDNVTPNLDLRDFRFSGGLSFLQEIQWLLLRS